MSVYLDTSFLVSLYISDGHSAEAQERMGNKPLCWLTPLHRAEWAHAIERHVFLRLLSSREVRRLHLEFEGDRAAGVWIETALPELAFEICARLALRHAARLGTKTLDALHVASALELKAQRFWTFDGRQAELAHAEGLDTN